MDSNFTAAQKIKTLKNVFKMKTISIIFSLALLFSTLSSCDYDRIRASGDITSQEVHYSDFSGLKLSNAFSAYVSFSDTEEKIEIEANENLHDNIIVRKDGNNLIVKLKSHTAIRGKATLNVYITTKSITDFDISGASELILETPLIAEDASIELSGASEFYGELNLGRLELDSSGASNSNLFGNVGELDASLAGSSELKDYDLLLDKLDIRLSGASDAYVTVNKVIEIRGSGASTLNYKGNAEIGSKNLSGASKIKKRN